MKPDTHRQVTYEGRHCSLTIQQLSDTTVLIRISGTDVGEFGNSPMQDLKASLETAREIDLFIDARNVRGASIDVSCEWAKWLRANKVHLREVSMLTGSRFIQVTADFVRRFADLEGIMKIYTEAPAFDAALAETLYQR
jgi:hypothetical protein